jgi:toxin ParE1/3/4
MLVRWTPAAADDLEQVATYLKQHHPEYAQATVERLYAAAESLSEFTMRGRPGRQPGTRELVVTRLPYVVIYALRDDAVWIIRVLHTARERA